MRHLGILQNFDRTGQQEKKCKKLLKSQSPTGYQLFYGVGVARARRQFHLWEDYVAFGNFAIY
jgi:hypothetical protein